MKRSHGRNLFELADTYDLLNNTNIRKLVVAGAVTDNPHIQEVAEKAVVGKAIHEIQYPFQTQLSYGVVRLGTTFHRLPSSITETDLTRHLLAVGQSGSGKTTLFYNLMDEVGKPFWAFDLKQDYRHYPGDDLLVLPWTELKFNPLKPPPGVSPRRWAQVFSEIFGHATSLLSGSKNYLMRKIIELYQLYNLFQQVSEPFPSLIELERWIEQEGINYVRKQSDYRDTLLNRLQAMNLVAGTVFDCSTGYSVEDLLQQDVVFEFDGLNRDTQNFLMEVLFAYVYEYRLAQNHRDQGLNHVFFLDEGKRVFSVYKERQDASGIPEIDELTAKMREFGEGLIVADQEASKLTESIKANTYTKLLLPTASQKQLQAVAASMNLSPRQREFAQQLETGEAVVQVGNQDPVPIRIPDYELEKQVTDSELEQRQRENWETLTYTPRDSTPGFEEALLSDNRKVEKEIPEDPDEEVGVSDDADRLLTDVVNNPFKPLTKRYQGFSSQYKGNKAKSELVDQGLVVERKVKTGEKRKLLELTEKGRDYARDSLDLETKQRGRGGVIHRYWQRRIQDVFEEAGWDAFREKFDADVYVNMGNTELAVEVAMGDNPREIQHVEKHLNRDFLVWITCRNQEIMDGLQQKLQEKQVDTDQVVFRLFRDFSEEEIP